MVSFCKAFHTMGRNAYMAFFKCIFFDICYCKFVTNFCSKFNFLRKKSDSVQKIAKCSSRSSPVVLLSHVVNELVSLYCRSAEGYFK